MAEIGALESVAHVRITDLLCEGRIKGLVNGLSSVWLEETRVRALDGTYNFPDFEISMLKGEPGQSLSAGLVFLETEPAFIDALVQFSAPVTRTVEDLNAQWARVIISFAALFVQDLEEGDTDALSRRIRITVIDRSGEEEEEHEVVDDTIHGEELGPFEINYEFHLDGGGPWDIRVQRLSEDDPDSYHHSEFKFSRLIEIIREKFSYDGSAVASMYFNMRSFGGRLPKRKYEIDGMIVSVPSNYDPVSKVYDGIWDGTFKQEFTDNPAWVCYDALTNRKHGAGYRQVDKWGFYGAGKFCDVMVPDGEGNFEPRYTFNGILEGAEEGLIAAQAIASCFRGNISWTGSKFVIAYDGPGEVIKVINPTDVINGEFFTQGDPASGACSVCVVTYTDPNTGEPDIYVEEDNDLIDRIGYKEVFLYAVGCNRRTQARRLALWYLDTIKNEAEVVTWRAGFDQIDVIPGMVVAIADPATAVVRNGGRVRSSPSLTQVILDRPIAQDSATTAYLMMPDGTAIIRPVNISGTLSATLNFNTALPAKPLPESVWAVETLDVRLRLARVMGMKEVERGIFELSAITHDPNKFFRVEQGKTIDPPDYTSSGSLKGPFGLELGRFYRVGATGRVEACIYAFWEKGDDRLLRYEVDVRASEVWASKGRVNGQSIIIPDNALAFDAFRVRGLDLLGRPTVYNSRLIPVLSRGITISVTEVEPRGARRITWLYELDQRLGAITQFMLDGKQYAVVPAFPQELLAPDFPLTGSHQLQILGSPGVASTYILAPLGLVAGLDVNFTREYRDGVPYVDPDLAWIAKNNSVYYEVWVRREGAQWALHNITDGLASDLPHLASTEANAQWQYAVVAVAENGVRLTPEEAARVNFQPGFDDTPPPIPTGLVIEETAERLRRLHWTVNTSPGIAGYEIRAIIGSTTDWEAGVGLHTGLIRTSPFELRSIPPYTSALAMKAVDINGNKSDPVYIVVSLSERPIENLIIKNDLHPAFSGTLTKGTLVAGVIIGPNTTPIMYDGGSMWNTDSSVPMYSGGDYQNYDYAHTLTLPTGIMSIQAAFVGPALFDYKIGSGPYIRYSSPVRIPAGSVTVRAYGPSAAIVEMKLTQLSVIVDVDDVVESVNNLTIASGGTRVPKTKGYTAILDVVVTLAEQASPVRPEVTDRNASLGPLVKVRRLSDNADIGGVALSVLLKGYA